MDQVEDRISGLEDKAEELDQTSKEYGNKINEQKKTTHACTHARTHARMGTCAPAHAPRHVQERHMQKLWDTTKRPTLHIIGIDKREESQVNGTD